MKKVEYGENTVKYIKSKEYFCDICKNNITEYQKGYTTDSIHRQWVLC
jgi:hypothetical protein